MVSEAASGAWDIQPGEPPEAYRAFTFYLTLGTWRSMQKAWDAYQVERAQAEGKRPPPSSQTPGHWTRWSARFSWVDRANAWDVEQARRAREALAGELEGIARQRVNALRIMLGKGLQLIGKADVTVMTPSEANEKLGVASNMISTAVNGLRLEMGDPDHRVHVTSGEPDLDDLSTEELERIVAEGIARRRASLEPPEGGDEPERLLPDDVPELHDGSALGATSPEARGD